MERPETILEMHQIGGKSSILASAIRSTELASFHEIQYSTYTLNCDERYGIREAARGLRRQRSRRNSRH